MKRNVLNSPRLRELKNKKRQAFMRKNLLYFFLFAAIFALAAYVSRIPALNISDVQITGNKVLDAEEIKLLAETELAGNYFFVFPKTNVFFYPKNKIQDRIATEKKRLKDAVISIQDRNTLNIAVDERDAAYTWCGDDFPGESAESESPKCHFVDESGYIFDEAPYFSGDVYFKFYGPNFSEVDFAKLLSFKDAFIAMNLAPVALHADATGTIRVFLSAANSNTAEPEIIFKSDSDFQKTLGNLETALNTEPLRANFRDKYSSLEYIDLRFGNKVYYRFR